MTEEMTYAEDDTLPETIDYAEETLTGDMRDTVMGWLKHTPKPWQQMSEMEQRHMADTILNGCEDIVRKAVNIIASNKRACIRAVLEQYTEKDGLKITLKAFGRSETVVALHEACGQEVLIVVASSDAFEGERAEVDIDKDEPNLFDQTSAGMAAE